MNRRALSRLTATGLAGAIIAFTGCDLPDESGPSMAHPDERPRRIELEVSDLAAPFRATVGVAVRIDPGGRDLVALAGLLTFDPGSLRYLGQPQPNAPFAIVNARGAEGGVLRLAIVDPDGLTGRAATLLFERLRPAVPVGLRFRVEGAVDRALAAVGAWQIGSPRAGDGMILGTPRRLVLADWLAWARTRYSIPDQGGPHLAPGSGLIYGDIDLDGAISIFDAFGVANTAVGNFALTDATKDYVIAANVVPFNLPGLGEPTDPLPPGVEFDGSRNISIFDAAAISTDAVNCNAYPIGACPPTQSGNQPVVGDLIPGRAPVGNRVVVMGDISAGRQFTADTIYELQGMVRVPYGVTLTIDAGTRVEGDDAARGSLLVARGGRLVASGTLVQPIVFACADPNPGPACWGGIVINGFAPLNTEYTGPGPVPICPEKTVPGTTEVYGGCLIQHDSGVLRYLRIEHAGQPWPALGASPGLSLNGVGSGTVIEAVQVHGSSGDGVFVSGGHAWIREILVTQNLADGLRWDDGWQGKAQQVIVYRTTGTGSGFRGSNSPTNPDAGPRSAPIIYNATIVDGNPMSPPASPALQFESGSAGVVRNLIVLGWTGTGLEIQGAESCARAADSLDVAIGVLWGNAANFSTDADCIDEAAYGGDPLRDFLLADPALRDVATTLSPDFRPSFGSIAATGVAPPGDGFFNPMLTYRGGAPVSTAAGSIVPWFTGWTRGFQ